MSTNVALITGGAKGIGRGIGLDLAARQWKVAFCYRTSEAAAKDTAAAIIERGGQALSVRLQPRRAVGTGPAVEASAKGTAVPPPGSATATDPGSWPFSSFSSRASHAARSWPGKASNSFSMSPNVGVPRAGLPEVHSPFHRPIFPVRPERPPQRASAEEGPCVLAQ